MSNTGHDIKYIEDKGLVRAVCSCLSAPSGWGGRGDAQVWAMKHIALVQQARVHLRGSSPSIKNQWEYFTDKANDPEESPENRKLWQQLADELHSRVPKPVPPDRDEMLPFDVTYSPKRKPRR